METIGYEADRCHFCNGGSAGYQRAEDSRPSGPFFDACEECASKPYPVPVQFRKADTEQVAA